MSSAAGSKPALGGADGMLRKAPAAHEDPLEREADRAAAVALARVEGGASAFQRLSLSPALEGSVQKQGSGAAQGAGDEALAVGSEQVPKNEFLDEVRRAVCEGLGDVLAGSGQTAEGCPYLELAFRYLERRDAAFAGRMLARFAPELDGSAPREAYVASIVERVRAVARRWVGTGEVTGLPTGLPAYRDVAQAAGSEGGPEAPALQHKARDGERSIARDPSATAARLGPGRALDGPVAARMGRAFGNDFSGVRIHTDADAGALSGELHARAFTVGRHVAFGSGEYQPGSLRGDALIAHELAHVVQQSAGRAGGLALQRCDDDTPNYAPTSELGHKLSDADLNRRIHALRTAQEALDPDSEEAKSLEEHVSTLEQEFIARDPRRVVPEEEGEYPREVALLSSYLIRGGYMKQVAELLPAGWRKMSEAELTAYLSKNFTPAELEGKFLAKYKERTAIKAKFRTASLISALVIGLIWARENLAEGEWDIAAAKVGGSMVAAWAFNKALYARDPAAKTIMARRAGAFGRWFQGAARTNRAVNFLVRRIGGALLLWDAKDFLMSGGGGGPNIPFDIIYNIDLDDPSTWEEPSQTLLDLGFNIWYRQACDPAKPETCNPEYVGKVEGSATIGALKLLDIAPHTVAKARDRLYRIEGEWGAGDYFIVGTRGEQISADDHVLVIGTGRRSGSKMGGTGHYRELEVVPANDAALELLGGMEPRWVRESLLRPVDLEELGKPK